MDRTRGLVSRVAKCLVHRFIEAMEYPRPSPLLSIDPDRFHFDNEHEK